MKLIDVAQMRELDRRTIEDAGIPGEVLMERAGIGAAEEILKYSFSLSESHYKRFVILAGKGNNGGDAYVVARYLYENCDIEIKLFAICGADELTGDAKLNAERLPEDIDCEIRTEISTDDFRDGDIVIEGLLGTGIKGALRSPYDQWIATVNSLELPVIALDIPSGMNGDDGTVVTDSIIADLTVTMGLPKTGFINGKGPELCGRLRCVDIGVPDSYIEDTPSDLEMIFTFDIRKFLSRIPMDNHKGSRGKVLVVGGSSMYPGAPFLSAESAIRAGAGLVYLALPVSAEISSTVGSHALITRMISDNGRGVFSEVSEEFQELIQAVDAVVCGPGISNNREVYPILKYLNTIEKPVLYDADALNLIAEKPSLLSGNPSTVLTPHPGEMRRLLKGFGLHEIAESDRTVQARELTKKTNTTIVLKGHRTVIASPCGKTAINSSGSPALATAGSGDVLSGIIGTWLAQGEDVFDAAIIGTFIHGLAGELSEKGIRGLIADDLLDLIPQAMKEISPFA